jgi:hypothetical protein
LNPISAQDGKQAYQANARQNANPSKHAFFAFSRLKTNLPSSCSQIHGMAILVMPIRTTKPVVLFPARWLCQAHPRASLFL